MFKMRVIDEHFFIIALRAVVNATC